MSSTEPPAGSTPPPGEPTPPPPPPAAAPPPPNPGTVPPPPPPPAGAVAPGMPGAAYGPGQPGSLLDRFLGRLIDSLVIGIPTVIVVTILAVASGSWLVSNLIAGVLYSAAYVGYFAFMESSRGQGIGKQVMKLKVVGPDGVNNPTMEQAVRRNIWLGAFILYVIPILGPLLGLLIILAS